MGGRVKDESRGLNIKRVKRRVVSKTVPLWVALTAVIGSLTLAGAALMTAYTSIPITFEVEKAVVIVGETYDNGTYMLKINAGSLRQGENFTTVLQLVNNADRSIAVTVKCSSVKLIYQSGYKTSKSIQNASKDWGIGIILNPSGAVTLPAKSTVNMQVELQIALNAQIACSSDPKYAGYELCLAVEPII